MLVVTAAPDPVEMVPGKGKALLDGAIGGRLDVGEGVDLVSDLVADEVDGQQVVDLGDDGVQQAGVRTAWRM